MDYKRKQPSDIRPLCISRSEVERVDSFKYLSVIITQNLSWSLHVNRTVKNARERLCHLRRLRDFRLLLKVLRNFYTCTIASILSGSITTWMGSCKKQDVLALGG